MDTMSVAGLDIGRRAKHSSWHGTLLPQENKGTTPLFIVQKYVGAVFGNTTRAENPLRTSILHVCSRMKSAYK